MKGFQTSFLTSSLATDCHARDGRRDLSPWKIPLPMSHDSRQSSAVSPAAAAATLDPDDLQRLIAALNSIRFGHITIDVQNGKVIRIDRIDRRRIVRKS